MHLHIDADYLAYTIGFACENKETKEVEPLANVLSTVRSSINTILAAAPKVDGEKPSPFTLYLTGQNNFRNVLYPEYKANRVKDKPQLYHIIRTYLEEHWGAVVVEGMEADDAVSIALHKDKEAVCVSMDKDLQTVAGWHMNPRKLEEGLVFVSEDEADASFWMQMLTGDTTDNIPGVVELPLHVREKWACGKRKGVGVKTAEKILLTAYTPAERYARVREAYSDDSRLLLNGRLLHMTRELNEDGSPKLWELPA